MNGIRHLGADSVQETAKEVFIPLTVGGGIQSVKNIKNSKIAITTSLIFLLLFP